MKVLIEGTFNKESTLKFLDVPLTALMIIIYTNSSTAPGRGGHGGHGGGAEESDGGELGLVTLPHVQQRLVPGRGHHPVLGGH